MLDGNSRATELGISLSGTGKTAIVVMYLNNFVAQGVLSQSFVIMNKS